MNKIFNFLRPNKNNIILTFVYFIPTVVLIFLMLSITRSVESSINVFLNRWWFFVALLAVCYYCAAFFPTEKDTWAKAKKQGKLKYFYIWVLIILLIFILLFSPIWSCNKSAGPPNDGLPTKGSTYCQSLVDLIINGDTLTY